MMTGRNIAAELAEGLEELIAWKRGEVKLNTFEMNLPRAEDVVKIRKNLNLSQDAFATFMGVSAGTLRNWEQHRREPQGPARALLQVAAAQPRAVMAAFKSAVKMPIAKVSRKESLALIAAFKSATKKPPAKVMAADKKAPAKKPMTGSVKGKASAAQRKAA
jgi:putative transcriptional regulator